MASAVAITSSPATPAAGLANGGYQEILDAFDKRLIGEALEQTGGRIREAARVLDIARNTLKAKMDQTVRTGRHWVSAGVPSLPGGASSPCSEQSARRFDKARTPPYTRFRRGISFSHACTCLRPPARRARDRAFGGGVLPPTALAVSVSRPRRGCGGRVLGDDSPLAAASVYLYHLADAALVKATTDEHGGYCFDALPAGLYKVVAFKPGFLPAVVMLTRAAADLRQSVDLGLRGRVVQRRGGG